MKPPGTPADPRGAARRMVFEVRIRDGFGRSAGTFGTYQTQRDATAALESLKAAAPITRWEIRRRLVSLGTWEKASTWGG